MKQVKILVAALMVLAGSLRGWAQIVEVHSFTNLNRSVPDGNPAGLGDARSMTSAVTSLSSVRVRLRVAGEFNGDLYAYVRQVNAAGTNWCVLLNRPGRTASAGYGYSDDGLDVIFDDVAPNGDIHNYRSVTNIPNGSPLAGFWKPDGRTSDPAGALDSQVPATSLHSFSGGDANGVWTLFLADLDSGATHTLRDWEIELTGSNSPPISSPVLEPIPDQIAYVLMPLFLTNRITDSNLVSQPLTYGLATGAPNGARVNRASGVFGWTPARAQARSTNVITVWMTDSGSPPVNATNTFTVVVDDYVELILGRSVLLTGQTSSVPVTLATSTGLTNLQALVQMPEDRLLPLALTGWPPEVGSATLQQQSAGVWRMEFTAAPGQTWQGTQELARLNFLALTNRSAFVPLVSVITTNLQTNGLSVWRTLTGDGRAVVLEREPLLEALTSTNGLPNLILYGTPGFSYEVQFSSLPAGGGWQPQWLGTMPTNFWMQVSGLTNTGPTMYFRARVSTGP